MWLVRDVLALQRHGCHERVHLTWRQSCCSRIHSSVLEAARNHWCFGLCTICQQSAEHSVPRCIMLTWRNTRCISFGTVIHSRSTVPKGISAMDTLCACALVSKLLGIEDRPGIRNVMLVNSSVALESWPSKELRGKEVCE